jgi:hypothetical protein
MCFGTEPCAVDRDYLRRRHSNPADANAGFRSWCRDGASTAIVIGGGIAGKGADMKRRQKITGRRFAASLLALVLLSTSTAVAEEVSELSRGQTVYVPVYSRVWYGNLDSRDKPSTLLLSSMLSVRNTDPDHSITVRAVRYYDTDGKLLRDHRDPARILGPFASTDVFVECKDPAGGSRANFIVVWDSDAPVNPPVIESVNTHYTGTALTAFTSRGQPIRSRRN